MTDFKNFKLIKLKRIAVLCAALFFFAALNSAAPGPAAGAETEESAADDVTRLQLEISGDIAKLRPAVEAELAGMKLGSRDIALRLDELAAMTETASDDMAAWGYTDEQRKRHTQALSRLSVAYTAYASAEQGQMARTQTSENGTASEDVTALGTVTSPDINASDALRQEINKVSQGLNTQVFYLQSKLTKLRLDLSETARLKRELQAAQEGNSSLALPRTHVLELENARLNVVLSWLQLRGIRQSFDQNVALVQRLTKRLVSIKDSLTFPEAVLNANLEKIQGRITELTKELESAKKSLDSASASLTRARMSLGSADVTPLTAASSIYLARSARATYWEYMTSLLDDEISFMRENQQVWRDRYKLFHDQASGDEIWKLRDNAQRRIQELQRQLESLLNLENATLRQSETTQAQMDEEELTGAVQQNLMQAFENQRRIVLDVLNRYEALIPVEMFLQQRLYNEANDNLGALRLAEKVTSFSRETVLGFLNTELWQGEGYSVTVWRLVVAVLVFLSSFFLSSLGSRWLKNRMIKRFKASTTAANATQRIVFYILWIAFALIALNIVEIPLTAFAFMGGAMAVGLGFGMQNIFNNLISGFIVIFSRPFKVNDIISVAGTEGTVQDIGSRSTTIKTWDGLDVVLPNRYFLENSVTNWTGSDQKKRNVFQVSVSYGSDTRHVEELLMRVVKSHSKVLKDPAPFVVFKNFGDSSLDFEVYFWIDLRQASGIKVASDMRHYIVSLFRDEGIEIPYPQRALHVIPAGLSTAGTEDTEAENAKTDAPEDGDTGTAQ